MHQQVKPVRRVGETGSKRRTVFRTVRLFVALGLVAAMCYLGWRALTVVATDQAYITAEIVPMRAPIAGELRLKALEPGKMASDAIRPCVF